MLLDFVVCDDIRSEVGDKSTLVGVYGDVIRLSFPGVAKVPWPVLLPKLGVYLRTKPVGEFVPENFSLTFLHNGVQVGQFGGTIRVLDAARPITLAVVATPFPLPGPGLIQFQLKFTRGDQTKDVPVDRTVAVEVTGQPH